MEGKTSWWTEDFAHKLPAQQHRMKVEGVQKHLQPYFAQLEKLELQENMGLSTSRLSPAVKGIPS